MRLPDGTTLDNIASLDPADRITEMEFLLQVAPHWLHGYMDLVFRIENPDSRNHPWRYFVLDWKSDLLPRYDETTIRGCITRRHYDLQARLYSHALDKYLQGILGAVYDPEKHLGGAFYLFMREHESQPLGKSSVWTYGSSPKNDGLFAREKIEGVLA